MKNILQALNKTYAECGYVQKKGRNETQNYKYAGEEQFIKDVRPAMVENGLLVLPVGYEVLKVDTVTTKNGGEMERQTIRGTFEILHTSGESLRVVGLGEGTDGGDKAIYKAMTGAYKYAIKQSFMIATGNDPEADESVDKEENTVVGIKAPTKEQIKPSESKVEQNLTDQTNHLDKNLGL